MTENTVRLTCNGLGAQVYLPREVFRHSHAEVEPGDTAVLDVLEDGRIAIGPIDKHDAPVDGRRRETTGDDGRRRESTGDDGRRSR